MLSPQSRGDEEDNDGDATDQAAMPLLMMQRQRKTWQMANRRTEV
jgi:hypothetical protein